MKSSVDLLIRAAGAAAERSSADALREQRTAIKCILAMLGATGIDGNDGNSHCDH